MAEELQLDSLKEIKKADYVKAFKNKAVWKKAKAVIFLVDYKLEGKKTTILYQNTVINQCKWNYNYQLIRMKCKAEGLSLN